MRAGHRAHGHVISSRDPAALGIVSRDQVTCLQLVFVGHHEARDVVERVRQRVLPLGHGRPKRQPQRERKDGHGSRQVAHAPLVEAAAARQRQAKAGARAAASSSSSSSSSSAAAAAADATAAADEDDDNDDNDDDEHTM